MPTAGLPTGRRTADERWRTDRRRTSSLQFPFKFQASCEAPAARTAARLKGGCGDGAIAEQQTHFSTVADNSGFIVVYPDGTSAISDQVLLTWNAGRCCGYAVDKKVDDVKFVGTVLDTMASQFHTDPARV